MEFSVSWEQKADQITFKNRFGVNTIVLTKFVALTSTTTPTTPKPIQPPALPQIELLSGKYSSNIASSSNI